MKTCSVEICDGPVRAKGLCASHYARHRKGADITTPIGYQNPKRECAVILCNRIADKTIYCNAHYRRNREGKDMTTPIVERRSPGTGSVNAKGYVVIRVGDDEIREHRKIMGEIIGRELLPNENVHHKNGVRWDNRPENLELWVIPQPPGQRVEDIVAWAKELLATYEPTALS